MSSDEELRRLERQYLAEPNEENLSRFRKGLSRRGIPYVSIFDSVDGGILSYGIINNKIVSMPRQSDHKQALDWWKKRLTGLWYLFDKVAIIEAMQYPEIKKSKYRSNPDEDLRELQRRVEADPHNQTLRQHFRRSLVRVGRGDEAGWEVGDLVEVTLNPNPLSSTLITRVQDDIKQTTFRALILKVGEGAWIQRNVIHILVKPLQYIWNRAPEPIETWRWDGNQLVHDYLHTDITHGLEVVHVRGRRALFGDTLRLLESNYCPSDALIDLWQEAKD